MCCSYHLTEPVESRVVVAQHSYTKTLDLRRVIWDVLNFSELYFNLSPHLNNLPPSLSSITIIKPVLWF